MKIGFANDQDYDYLTAHDRHVRPDVVRAKIQRNEIIMMRDHERPVGWLRYGYFCDIIPFMNMLYIEEDRRGKGLGTRLIAFWEEEMRKRDHDSVMTSSQSNERAQHLYRRLGYRDCGCLLLPDDPLEILFLKMLD
jgi:ribosomal protein S18 acetylase RimI-like enzyme